MADITMPKMGFDMEQGTIVRWLKNVGDKIDKGQAIAEIETDKVTIEIESFASGTLTKIVADEGAVVPVGAVIAELDGPSGAAATAPSNGAPAKAASSDAAPATASASRGGEGGEATSAAAKQTTAASDTSGSAPAPEQPKAATGNGERVFASPMARRLAGEAGLEIAEIKGSGPGGRIVRRDVESFAQQPRAAAPAAQAAAPAPTPAAESVAAAPAAQPAPTATAAGAGRREPLSRLRQTIARRLSQAKREVPHYYVTVAIDMTAAMELRKQLNSLEGVKISVNDMVVKACALALKQFPTLNASFGEDSLIMHDQINVSIAIATDNGLLAPAITDVDKKSLGVLAAETRELAERTRSGKATPDELGRGTFTVSNLGMFGVESFVAIINPPQAAIVAVGAATETPVVKDGQVVIAPIMKATISADHRVSDGVVGAQYLQAVKALLETPMRLLV
jgi:pyruvate dehydrogenase E2 component (dihydrolipoamide acetyltransferase)